ncbi:serine hydrolase [Candidatus Poriferisodalis sp.]|uniref:serine hydrolase n=1 Tax=Candidatus Poriferisodalis sp. TaxID=3101277 RepID=UPI003B5C24F9
MRLHEPFDQEWSANAELRHPAASLLKVPVVAAALIAGAEGRLSLDERIDPKMLETTVYPTIQAAFDGSTLSLREIAALSIVTSDNAAASAILDAVGDAAIKDFLERAGCRDTDPVPGFSDADFENLRGAYTTAVDQYRILTQVWSSRRLGDLRRWLTNNLRNTRLSARIEPPRTFAHKTGTLCDVAHDVGMLSTPQCRASVIVLTSKETDPTAVAYKMAGLGSQMADELDCLTAG